MDSLPFVIVGHVDHGKSTLIGRLLYDTESLPPDKIEEIRRASSDLGRETEFAYLLDHLEEERRQGVTIDTTQVFFSTPNREYVIIDAPGHVEFVKNMATGASQADAAVLIVDAKEGVREQTTRHAYILSLLGVRQIIVVCNKMDLAGYSQEAYRTLHDTLTGLFDSLSLSPLCYIPISAMKGDNVAIRSDAMPWYRGPTLLESLDSLAPRTDARHKPLLFPVQDIYKIDNRRIAAGRVEAGSIRNAQHVTVLPGGETTTISTIEKFMESRERADAGESIGITTDSPVFINRGDVLCEPGNKPAMRSEFQATVFWMSKQPCRKGARYTLRIATQETPCTVKRIDKRIDSSTFAVKGEDADVLDNLDAGEVLLATKKPLALTAFHEVQELGRFVLVDDDAIFAGGIVTDATHAIAEKGEQ